MYIKDNLDLALEWLSSQEEPDWTPLERALFKGGDSHEEDHSIVQERTTDTND